MKQNQNQSKPNKTKSKIETKGTKSDKHLIVNLYWLRVCADFEFSFGQIFKNNPNHITLENEIVSFINFSALRNFEPTKLSHSPL